MYTSKSFCHVDTFVSNDPGVDNTLGEVTARIQTFSRDVGKYANNAYPNLTLYALYSKDGLGADAISQPMPAEIRDMGLNLSNQVVVVITSTTGELFQDVLQDQLAAYGANIGAVGIEVGPINQHGSRWAPDFIRFRPEDDTTQEHTIWFSTLAIDSQYTDYEIVIVPPFEPLDNFFTTPGNVNNLLNAITQSATMIRINEKANGFPYTDLVSSSFDYYNPQNPSQRYNTNWVTLHYGPAGMNIDSIKDALVDYILANSTHTREEWMTILPDIFKRTEFVIVPNWPSYAVEPLQLYPQGVRSPVFTIEELLDVAVAGAVEYQEAHIRDYVQSTVFNYTSVGAAVIGNVENRDGKFLFTDYYPDYFLTPTTSTDFSRMTPATQNWVTTINTMLAHAETMTATSTVPAGFQRIKRSDMIYISKTIGNVAYLVACKGTVVAALTTPPDQN